MDSEFIEASIKAIVCISKGSWMMTSTQDATSIKKQVAYETVLRICYFTI